MTAYEAERLLRDHGVQFDVVGERLRYRAPRGVLTDDLRHLIHEHRDGLLILTLVTSTFARIHEFWVPGAVLPPAGLEEAIDQAAARQDPVAVAAALTAYEAAAMRSCRALAPRRRAAESGAETLTVSETSGDQSKASVSEMSGDQSKASVSEMSGQSFSPFNISHIVQDDSSEKVPLSRVDEDLPASTSGSKEPADASRKTSRSRA